MTLLDAKNEVAKKYGQRSWSEWNEARTFPMAGTIHDEAAYIYAKSKWDEAVDLARKTGPAKPEFKP